MRHNKQNPLLGLCLLGLVGCAATQLPVSTGFQGGYVELVPHVKAGRLTQAVRFPNTGDMIATLSITPYIFNGAQYRAIDASTGLATDSVSAGILQITLASPSMKLNQKFRLNNLRYNTNYKFIGRAYDSNGVQISLDTSSSVNMTVGTSATPTLGTLPIVLLNTTFNATQSVNIISSDVPATYLASITAFVNGILQTSPIATTSIPGFLDNVEFDNLCPNTNYRIELAALGNSQEVLATNSIDVSVINDDELATQTIHLELPV